MVDNEGLGRKSSKSALPVAPSVLASRPVSRAAQLDYETVPLPVSPPSVAATAPPQSVVYSTNSGRSARAAPTTATVAGRRARAPAPVGSALVRGHPSSRPPSCRPRAAEVEAEAMGQAVVVAEAEEHEEATAAQLGGEELELEEGPGGNREQIASLGADHVAVAMEVFMDVELSRPSSCFPDRLAASSLAQQS